MADMTVTRLNWLPVIYFYRILLWLCCYSSVLRVITRTNTYICAGSYPAPANYCVWNKVCQELSGWQHWPSQVPRYV